MEPEAAVITKEEKSILNDIQFTDIFDINEIQRMQDLFSDATGVASLITHPDGTPITQASNFSNLCKLVRTSEKGQLNCIKSDAYIGSQNPGGITIKQCLSAGLWDASVGIHVEGKHIASWLIGQVRTQGVDILKIINYADEIGVDREKYLEALNNAPIMSIERFQSIANMLSVFANELTQKAFRNNEFNANIAEKERVNALLHKSEESLSITLNSIADAVISTDISGNVIKMNPVAENLCQWYECEAIGQSINKIFKLYNSKTNLPIENPIEKVIRTGKTLELSNHAVLTSKHGKQMHISNSAAPIKNKEGQICGAVLVFSDITEKYLSEEAIRQSEVRYRGLMNNLNSGIVVHEADTSISFNNSQASVLLGLSSDQLQGKKAIDSEWKFVDENESTLAASEYPVNRILKYKKPIKDQVLGICQSSNKEIVWVNVNGFPVFKSNSEISQIIVSFDDISIQKRNADKLKEKEKFLLATQKIAKLGSYIFDLKTLHWESSQLLDEIFGIDTDYEKTMHSWLSIIHPNWQKGMENYLEFEVLGKKHLFDREYKVIRINDKSERWVHGMGELVFDKYGNAIKLIGTIQDITDRKQNEEKLQKSEEKYRNIFENVQDVFYQVNLQGKIFELSPSAKNYSDFFDYEKTADVYIQDLYANLEDRTRFLEIIRKEGEVRDYELDLIGKKGQLKHVSINAKLIWDKFGNPSHINGALRDITKRKMAQDALLESENFLKEIQSIARIGNWTLDFETETWKSSEVLDQIFGFDNTSAKSLTTLSSVIQADWLEELTNYFYKTVLANHVKFDKKFKIIRLNDKAERWVHVIAELKTDANNRPKVMIGTVQDITLRKNSKEALRKSEELYRSILNASPDDITVTDLEGKIIMASPKAYTLFGFKSDDEIIGHNALENIIPEDQLRAQENIKSIAGGKNLGPQMFKCLHTNGSIVEVEVNFQYILDRNNEPYGFVFIIRDISERKKNEEALRKSQKALKKFAAHLQNVREEERNSLAREIHDDLGQILIAMKIDLGLLSQRVLKIVDNKHFTDVKTQFDALYSLVDNTLKSARRIMTDLRPEVLDMLGFTDTVKQHLANFEERHKIKCIFDNQLTNLQLNTDKSVALFRIVQEALNNVSKHSRASQVIIRLSILKEILSLEVIDNGIGFEQNEKKNPDSYGLMGMKERVYILDGQLEVKSIKNEGTCVKVTMPYP